MTERAQDTDSNPFGRLAAWFARHCDGDWEHGEGITIETLDNPGWSVRISLAETELEGRDFQRVQIERSEDDWLRLWVENHTFNIACGTPNVEEALRAFLAWASTGEFETGGK
jgi:hypothetical protein